MQGCGHAYLRQARVRESAVKEELPDASRGELGELGTDEGSGGGLVDGEADGEVDAQALLSAASRAIAAVRRQAAGLLRHHSDPHDDSGEPTEEPPSVT